jgi:REP element-mobilizing transposase RayT
MAEIITEHPHYFTATILKWKMLLFSDKYKDIVIESMRFLVNDKRVLIYGFVIMNNHIHIIWHLQPGKRRDDVQRDFLKYTAQQIKKDMLINYPNELEHFRVNAKDRKYQFWERNPLSVEIWTERVMIQKLKYIHENPVRAGLCRLPEKYRYSSAQFYYTGTDHWGFLTHYLG